MRYLNLLAEYRLCTRIKEETDAFLEGRIYIQLRYKVTCLFKGLNSIIPDELLAIFDETELEVNIIHVAAIIVQYTIATDVWYKCFQV